MTSKAGAYTTYEPRRTKQLTAPRTAARSARRQISPRTRAAHRASCRKGNRGWWPEETTEVKLPISRAARGVDEVIAGHVYSAAKEMTKAHDMQRMGRNRLPSFEGAGSGIRHFRRRTARRNCVVTQELRGCTSC